MNIGKTKAMTDASDKVLDRIRKLIALAGSSNEHEAALAMSHAQALLAEHNLTLADITAKADDGFIIDKDIVTSSYPWRRQLANAVATLYFCRYFYQPVKVKKTMYDVHCFTGEKHNIAVAKMMFDYLHHTVDRLAKEGARKVPPKQRSPYRVSFRSACTTRLIMRIAERIEEAKAGKIKTESGTTLPALASMYDQVGKKLEKFLDEKMGKMTQSKSKLALLHTEGLIDGDEAGANIGLDAQVRGAGVAHMLEDKTGEKA